jgi:hypothetical protein
MPPHAIRLRAAWEIRPGPDSTWTRIDLPLSPSTLPAGPATLRRRFRPPPIDPAAEELWLVLEAIPGVDSVDLNGREWLPEGRGLTTRIEAGPTNLLELRLGETASRATDLWGIIRLEIRPRGEGQIVG